MGWIHQVRDAGRFYWSAIKIAFSGKFGLAEKSSGAAALFIAVVAIYSRGWEAAMTWLPVLVFFAVFLATTFAGFLLGCYSLYRDQQQRALDAEAELAALADYRWINFALAVKEAMAENVNERMMRLTAAKRDNRATEEQLNELKDLSSFRTTRMRDNLWGAKMLARGRCPEGELRHIPAAFWRRARMGFRDGWAESGGLRYTKIEVAFPPIDRRPSA